MSLVGLELDDGNVLLRFTETAAENGGARHVQEARYAPRSSPPPYHFHPRQDERFTIVSGGLRFHLAGEDRDVGEGGELVVPAGTPHHAHNPHDRPAIVIRLLYAATRGRARPPLHAAAAILREYRDEFQLARPPLIVQRLVFGCLAPLGRRYLRAP